MSTRMSVDGVILVSSEISLTSEPIAKTDDFAGSSLRGGGTCAPGGGNLVGLFIVAGTTRRRGPRSPACAGGLATAGFGWRALGSLWFSGRPRYTLSATGFGCIWLSMVL